MKNLQSSIHQYKRRKPCNNSKNKKQHMIHDTHKVASPFTLSTSSIIKVDTNKQCNTISLLATSDLIDIFHIELYIASNPECNNQNALPKTLIEQHPFTSQGRMYRHWKLPKIDAIHNTTLIVNYPKLSKKESFQTSGIHLFLRSNPGFNDENELKAVNCVSSEKCRGFGCIWKVGLIDIKSIGHNVVQFSHVEYQTYTSPWEYIAESLAASSAGVSVAGSAGVSAAASARVSVAVDGSQCELKQVEQVERECGEVIEVDGGEEDCSENLIASALAEGAEFPVCSNRAVDESWELIQNFGFSEDHESFLKNESEGTQNYFENELEFELSNVFL
eukprot:CAMPEP_0182443798 /NCGR_PEP_ID=MMETSP1172-20130603/2432_1 /TAXON_ID=708627 /ORGANISM="Timspurckia oligopyrenoides, Strain CCMP3278" /LENGTH=332 /DNA_ID=CAMNT_0024639177 /DNA_START=403 /DNA_END=1397 /DNA_ORIENTATION=+